MSYPIEDLTRTLESEFPNLTFATDTIRRVYNLAIGRSLSIEDVRNIIESETMKPTFLDPNDGSILDVISKHAKREVKKETTGRRRGATETQKGSRRRNNQSSNTKSSSIETAITSVLTEDTSKRPKLDDILPSPLLVNKSQLPKEFMFDSIDRKVAVLNNRVERIAKQLIDVVHEAYPDVIFQNGTTASSGVVGLCGRIICDSEVGFSKLNLSSVMLEVFIFDKEEASFHPNSLVKLQLAQYATKDPLSLFPGQIAAVIGVQKGGNTFEVMKVYTDASLPLAEFKPQIPEISPVNGLKLIIASGPILTNGNVSENFTSFLQVVAEKRPSILLLLGPFVEQNVNYGKSYNSVFQDIAKALRKIDEHTRVALVPSLQDAHHFFVFPQPEFDLSFLNQKKKMQTLVSLTNPSIFEVKGLGGENEIGSLRIGVSTQSILTDLEKVHLSINSTSLLPLLGTHIISQQSFYPLMHNTNEVPLDFSMSNSCLEWSDKSPHILILPYSQAASCVLPNGTLLICPKTLQRIENIAGGYIEVDISVNSKTMGLTSENYNVNLINL